MKNKILLFSIALMMVISLVIASCAAPAPAPKPEPIVLKMVTFLPNYPSFDMGWDWKDKLEERAKGQLTIDYLGGSEVIPGFDQPEATSKGVVDMYWGPLTFLQGVVPETKAINLTEVNTLELRKRGFYELMNEVLHKNNVHDVGNLKTVGSGFGIHPNVLVEKPEDLKGLKLRSTSLYLSMLEFWGAIPVTMPGDEIYTAMERGVIDGFSWTFSSAILRNSWYEVTKYTIAHPFGGPDLSIVVNLDTWNRIPKPLQKLMVDTLVEVSADWLSHWEEDYTRLLKQLEEKGMEPIYFSEGDAKRYVDSFYEAGWAGLMEKAPEYGPKLREVSSK